MRTTWQQSYKKRSKPLLSKRLGRRWLACATVVLTIPLTGCVTEIFSGVSAAGAVGSAYINYLAKAKGDAVVVVPDLEDYSKSMQALASEELKGLQPPCPRIEEASDCSAIHRMVIDYGDLRRKIKASKDNGN